MSHRQAPAGDFGAHFLAAASAAAKVGDRAAILPDRGGDLLLGQAEFVCQPLVRQRFVDRIEVLALDVLDERELEQLLVLAGRDLADDDRHRAAPRAARRASGARRR